jgi:hypothetical protein
LKTQDFAHETYEIDEKEEEIFLNLSSISFLSRVSWAEKILFKQLLSRQTKIPRYSANAETRTLVES